MTSKDPLLSEASALLQDPNFCESQSYSDASVQLATSAKELVKKLGVTKAKTHCNKQLRSDNIQHSNDNLEQLEVQGKFKDVVDLETKNKTWSRILTGLPVGQMSFLIRAGTDTLPTPLNLQKWKMRSGARCRLCSSRSPTTLHILNGCPSALEQGRFTWRHDSVLQSLVSAISANPIKGVKVFADLPNHLAKHSAYLRET